MTALSEARALFRGAGLPFPSLPSPLAENLVRRSEWWFTTRDDDAPRPYFIGASVRSFVDGTGGDGIVLAHAGHGSQSWAIHCYLTLGRLGVFIQSAWGGAGTSAEDEGQEREIMAGRFVALDRLLALAGADDGPLPSGQLLAVVMSDFDGSRWASFAAGSAPAWHETPTPVDELVDVLVTRH